MKQELYRYIFTKVLKCGNPDLNNVFVPLFFC